MDKKDLSAIISRVYKSLTPTEVIVDVVAEQLIRIKVVSSSFQDMTFADRAKLMNDQLARLEPSIFKSFVFIFEGLTQDEVHALPKDADGESSISVSSKYSESAKDL